MEFEYKVTVIVPVYNAEKSIDRTMESLFQQTIAQDLMEIILIDDGSTDDSPRICDRYAAEHDNVRVIHQENKGVSAARNAGIRNARGKYLLYLDGDDTLSKETLENVTKFFDAHYNEVDVVTYPLQYRFSNGTIAINERYNDILKKSGVYSLKKYIYIAQTTINVCVKNRGKLNKLFEADIKIYEDQTYNLEICSEKWKIGYCAEACYWYFKNSTGVSEKTVSPNVSFELVCQRFEELFDQYSKNGRVEPYVQALLIYDCKWKIKSDQFMPTWKNETRLATAFFRLQRILNQVDTKVIIDFPGLDPAYKYYLISLRSKKIPFVGADADVLSIISDIGELSHQESIQIVINQVKFSSSGLYILAYLKCFAFAFMQEQPKVFAVLPDGNRKEVTLFASQYSCYWTSFKTNRFYAFHFSYDGPHLGKIYFEVFIHGRSYPTHFWYYPKGRVHPELDCDYLIGHLYALFGKREYIEIASSHAVSILQAKKRYEKKLFKSRKKLWLARRLMETFQNKRVWLYFDSHNCLDNGYYQFLHDIGKRDGIKRYYIYHADNPTLVEGKFSPKVTRSLVRFGSVLHKCLMAAAEKVLVAFADRTCYLPFDPDTYQYYSDLFHYDVIYLQHGVMHAKLPNMYSKEKVWQVDQIVASTTFEKENLLHLGYREKDILTCGMPRLDALGQHPIDRKKLLFAPSWRVSLVRTVDGVQTPVEGFYQSEYYREFSAFLEDEILHDFLDKNDLYLDVQIHPMFSCYADSFIPTGLKRIQMTRSANAADYLACITDFSSFMFDFIYLNKPVISYFPDREAFQTGSHSYSDFYYPLEDGFALYCEERMSVIDLLRQLCEDNFSLPPQLAERANGIYFSREANHREELYHALMGDK